MKTKAPVEEKTVHAWHFLPADGKTRYSKELAAYAYAAYAAAAAYARQEEYQWQENALHKRLLELLGLSE